MLFVKHKILPLCKDEHCPKQIKVLLQAQYLKDVIKHVFVVKQQLQNTISVFLSWNIVFKTQFFFFCFLRRPWIVKQTCNWRRTCNVFCFLDFRCTQCFLAFQDFRWKVYFFWKFCILYLTPNKDECDKEVKRTSGRPMV